MGGAVEEAGSQQQSLVMLLLLLPPPPLLLICCNDEHRAACRDATCVQSLYTLGSTADCTGASKPPTCNTPPCRCLTGVRPPAVHRRRYNGSQGPWDCAASLVLANLRPSRSWPLPSSPSPSDSFSPQLVVKASGLQGTGSRISLCRWVDGATRASCGL